LLEKFSQSKKMYVWWQFQNQLFIFLNYYKLPDQIQLISASWKYKMWIQSFLNKIVYFSFLPWIEVDKT
jgi:hypothetical protein